MKNALQLLSVLLLCGACTLAQAQTAPATKPMSGQMPHDPMAKAGCTMKDGKMMTMMGGQCMMMNGKMTTMAEMRKSGKMKPGSKMDNMKM